ncbi:MAG TPA: glutathione S-transferase family protein [Polyangiaceae bacterium]|nr:glutathione S-transferase family protein [Polyangiaceae bacterium]
MNLKLYLHPLSSFCWKVLIALYENETPFEPCIIDLGDPASRAELERLWPFRRFPVLQDRATGRVLPESSIIIEYLGQRYPGRTRLLPDDPELALETRQADRFYDLLVHVPMQKIVTDKIRPAGQNDPFGVEQARSTLGTAYALIDRDLARRTWAMGDPFTLADCAAFPALYYANRVQPLGEAHPHAAAYLRRLEQRPSIARVLAEAQPHFAMFPG